MGKTQIFRSEEGKQKLINYYEILIQNLKCAYQTKYVQTSLGKTHVIEAGNPKKSTIILIHGSSSNSAMWLQEIILFSKEYNVLAIDIPGECNKSEAIRSKLSTKLYSEWIQEILDFFGKSSVHIIGNSLGGWIGLAFAVLNSRRCESLTLIASGGIVPIKSSMIIKLIFTSLFKKSGFKKIAQIVYNDTEIDEKVLEFALLSQEYFIPRTENIPLFSDDELKLIRCPMLYLAGQHDCFYHSTRAAERLNQMKKGIETIVYEEKGHVLTNCYEDIRGFIEGL